MGFTKKTSICTAQNKIKELTTSNKCSKACAAYFEAVHGIQPKEKILNPLDFYAESQEVAGLKCGYAGYYDEQEEEEEEGEEEDDAVIFEKIFRNEVNDIPWNCDKTVREMVHREQHPEEEISSEDEEEEGGAEEYAPNFERMFGDEVNISKEEEDTAIFEEMFRDEFNGIDWNLAGTVREKIHDEVHLQYKESPGDIWNFQGGKDITEWEEFDEASNSKGRRHQADLSCDKGEQQPKEKIPKEEKEEEGEAEEDVVIIENMSEDEVNNIHWNLAEMVREEESFHNIYEFPGGKDITEWEGFDEVWNSKGRRHQARLSCAKGEQQPKEKILKEEEEEKEEEESENLFCEPMDTSSSP